MNYSDEDSLNPRFDSDEIDRNPAIRIKLNRGDLFSSKEDLINKSLTSEDIDRILKELDDDGPT